MRIKVLLANILWFGYAAQRSIKWRRAANATREFQWNYLRNILAENADTEFGRRFAFSSIDSIRMFQERVPIQTYEDISEYIDRIATGRQGILTREPIRRFGVTSGSTQSAKLIPYNDTLVSEFQEGIDPWVYRLMSRNPSVMRGPSYWSVTPVGDKERHTVSGIPIGFDDERAYFGKFTQCVLDSVMIVPSQLAQVKEMDAFRYATLRFLVAEKSLTWISVWNPTFLSLLLSPLEGWFQQLIDDVRTGSLSVELGVSDEVKQKICERLKSSQKRANELENIRSLYAHTNIKTERGATLLEAIWPKLALISCWAHGNAYDSLIAVRRLFPSVIIEPKGLVATEAFVSFPFSGEGSALSITSHFFEFEDVKEKRLFLAHELRIGCRYALIVTTGGGLYRYRLNDVIEVLGHFAECPIIRFYGRQEKVVDLVGEKLNEQFAATFAHKVFAELDIFPTFWMFAPNKEVHDAGYTLFVRLTKGDDIPMATLSDLKRRIEEHLSQSYHYEYARRLGQLAPLRLYRIDSDCDAEQVYLKTCTDLGQRLGDIKSSALHPYKDWENRFAGTYFT